MKTVDVFCGCGGLSLGLQEAGFDIVAAYDHWDKSVEVYNANFDHPCFKLDLSDREQSLAAISPYCPDVIVGGPPCQDFSSAGKRDVTLGRADLTYDYAYLVNALKPKWFIMENVDRIRTSHILDEIIEDFQDSGYGLTSVILDASLCGVPQARKRFFLIGELGGKHNTLLPYLQKNLSDTQMTVRDYLGESLSLEHYYRHPRNYSRRGIFSINEPSPTVRGVNRPLPKTYVLNSCDGSDIDLEKIRPLTTIERSYIQTFPESFVFPGTKTNLEQMIGNAVPVNMSKFVGNAIQSYISDNGNLAEAADNSEFILCQSVLKKNIEKGKKRQLEFF